MTPHFSPLPFQLEHRDVAAAATLKAALSRVEAAHPGFSYDLVLGLVRKGEGSSAAEAGAALNEGVLRLQGNASELDAGEGDDDRPLACHSLS